MTKLQESCPKCFAVPVCPVCSDTKTLRDEFAIAALTGFLAVSETSDWSWAEFAEKAYTIADEMMQARP